MRFVKLPTSLTGPCDLAFLKLKMLPKRIRFEKRDNIMRNSTTEKRDRNKTWLKKTVSDSPNVVSWSEFVLARIAFYKVEVASLSP